MYVIYIYINTPNIGLGTAVFDREREPGRFRGSTEEASGSTEEAGGASREQGGVL